MVLFFVGVDDVGLAHLRKKRRSGDVCEANSKGFRQRRTSSSMNRRPSTLVVLFFVGVDDVGLAHLR